VAKEDLQMKRFSHLLPLAVVLAVATLVGAPQSVRADLVIQVAENGGAFVTVASTAGSPTAPLGVTAAAISFDTAHYHIDVISGKEQQLTNLSELLSSTTSITRTVNGSVVTLNLKITGDGFTLPLPPVTVLSHVGGTVAVEAAPGGDTLAYHSIVGGNDVGAQNPDVSGVGSFANDKSALLNAGSYTSPFSLVETFDINLKKVGDTLNYSSSTTLSAVPAPAGVVLALSALPCLGLGAWVRRRKAKVVG